MRRSHWIVTAFPAAITVVLLASFFLRVYRLDTQSLWYDEGNSAVMASRTISQIIVNAAADIHPPFYYILLHVWSLATGNSEFALRYLSVVFGMLTVATAIALGCRLWRMSVGVLAGALCAISPFLVYYAQEARMYAQLCALASLSTYTFVRLAEIGTARSAYLSPATSQNRSDRGPWMSILGRDAVLPAAYVLTTSAMLYTQYFSFSVLLVQVALSLVLVLQRCPLRSTALLFLLQGIAVMLYAPWLPALFRQLGVWATSATQIAAEALLHNAFLVFSFGLSWDATTTSKSQLLVGIVLALGLVADLIRTRSAPGTTTRYFPAMLLLLVMPLGVVSLLEIRRPTYQPKLVIPAAVAFELLLSAGMITMGTLVSRLVPIWPYSSRRLAACVWRRRTDLLTASVDRRIARETRWWQAGSAIAVVLFLLLPVGFFDARSLRAYYFDSKYSRDDYRGVARFLEAQGTDGDAIVLNAPSQIEVLSYYYRGPLPQHPLPRQRPLDRSLTEKDLTDLAIRYVRVWIVEWAVNESDPESFINAWLGERYPVSKIRQFGQVKVLRYDLQAGRTEPN